MNPTVLAIVAARGAALALSLAGNHKASAVLRALADAAEAGVNIDDHMREVANRFKDGAPGTDADWDDVLARINAASADLQSVKPGG